MMTDSFKGIAIVACGTLSLELKHLQEEGFLDTEYLYFTKPGLHQDVHELEKQLRNQVVKAKEKTDKVIVVYGGKFCYVNADEPTKTMQSIIESLGSGVKRIQATHCMDMVASEEERVQMGEEMAGGERVWWMTPGWVKFRHQVFDGWDQALANENFPRHSGGAIVLDSIGFMDQYMAEKPEEFLEYCDWMGIPMQGCPCTLGRLKDLLLEQKKLLDQE